MSKKKGVPKEVIITGMVCLTLLECVAMFFGIDGTLFSLVVGVIAMAIGVTLPAPKLR